MLVLGLGTSGTAHAAANSEATGNSVPPSLLRLEEGRNHEHTLWVGGDERISLADLRQKPGPITIGGVTLEASPTDKSFAIHAGANAAKVVVDGLEGWSATLGNNQRASFRILSEMQSIEVTTAAENSDLVLLAFADGGTAALGAKSSLHFDLFQDQTYLVLGRGVASGINADGQKFILSADRRPMTGGPLVSVVDAFGQKRLARLSPATEVQIKGEIGARLHLVTGAELIDVPDTKAAEVVLRNGSVIRLERDRATKTLHWKVLKGHVRFSLEGIKEWKVTGSSGESASIVWDRIRQAVDLVNHSPESTLLVTLPHSTQARVGPEGAFQFVQVGPLLFSTSGSGGKVVLYNSALGQETDLARNNLLFMSGVAIPPGGRAMPNNAITASWNTDSSVEIRSPSGSIRLLPNEEKILHGLDGGQLEVRRDGEGKIRIKALVGNFTVFPRVLRNVSFALEEGNGILCRYNSDQGTFMSLALSENLTGIKMGVANGYNPVIQSDQKITFFSPALADAGGQAGQVIFQRGFGMEEKTAPDPDPFAGRYMNQLNADRISQSPISVVR